MSKIRVIFYERRRRANGNFSMEAIFESLRLRLKDSVDSIKRNAPCFSNGLWRRIRIVFDAAFPTADLMHVTGDIHFAVILRKANNTILTIHDCGDLVNRHDVTAKILKLFWFRIPVWRCGHVTTVSKATKEDVIALTGCREDKISVIYNAISDAFYAKKKTFNQDCPRILQIGTAPNKNLERLATALKGIRCRLVVIGKLSEEQTSAFSRSGVEFENLANLSESDLIQQYEMCDIVSFASLVEGFGMPIIEAQTVGRAVVTSDCSCMPEVAGDGACLVDPHAVESIRAGLLRIIHDEEYRLDLIQNGFENAKRFSAEEIASQYLSLYRAASKKQRRLATD